MFAWLAVRLGLLFVRPVRFTISGFLFVCAIIALRLVEWSSGCFTFSRPKRSNFVEGKMYLFVSFHE